MADEINYSEVTPKIQSLAGLCEKNGMINQELYSKYEVKRGRGILTERVFWRA